MLYVSVGIGLLFLALAFIINAENAKTWLSGYNTMSEDEQRAFPIHDYLKVFKRFHLLLGFVYILLAVAFNLLSPKYLGYHLALTPIAGYIFFIIRTRNFSQHTSNGTTMQYVGLGVLIVTFLGIVALIKWSETPTVLDWTEEGLHISGAYGLEVPLESVDSIYVMDALPNMDIRLHGIASGTTAKGKFKGDDGNTYHLLVDKPIGEVLCIERKNKPTLILALNGVNEMALYKEFQTRLD